MFRRVKNWLKSEIKSPRKGLHPAKNNPPTGLENEGQYEKTGFIYSLFLFYIEDVSTFWHKVSSQMIIREL